jgi:hypothetical protein
MANRDQNPGQNQTQKQKGRRNPETLPPQDDELEQEARRQDNQEPDEPLTDVEQEEDEADDEEGNEGTQRPS